MENKESTFMIDKEILINGIGCNISGGELVLNNFIRNVPNDLKIKSFLGSNNLSKPVKFRIKLYFLNHKIFGKYFRPFYDLIVSIFSFLFSSGYVLNLSNYGLPFFNKEIVYIHNRLLISDKFYIDNSSLANYYKKKALIFTLNKSIGIIVQTDHMSESLLSFCKNNKLKIEDKLHIFKPYHSIESSTNLKKKHRDVDYSFFYPASTFAHKRTDLAVEVFYNLRSNIKLNITINEVDTQYKSSNVNTLGKINFDNVIQEFQNADALLFTSEKESLGLPLLEALSLEKPAVLPDLPYAREIYGDSGCYFKEFTVESIKNAVIELTENRTHYKEIVKERKEVEFNNRMSWLEQWEYLKKIFEDAKN